MNALNSRFSVGPPDGHPHNKECGWVESNHLGL
jgi:hypothetical protein